MKNIIKNQNFKFVNIIISIFLVFLGLAIDILDNSAIEKFFNFTNNDLAQVIRVAGTFIAGVAGFVILIGKEGIRNLFNKPKRPVFYVFVGFVSMYVINFIIATILTKVLKLDLGANGSIETNLMPSLYSLPFLMVFEEVWTMTILLIVSNLMYKKLNDFNKSFWIGSIVSAIIFAAGHWTAYYHGGSVINTIIQLTATIAVSRIILNLLFKKSNTFTVPYVVHLMFDTTTFLLVMLSQMK